MRSGRVHFMPTIHSDESDLEYEGSSFGGSDASDQAVIGFGSDDEAAAVAPRERSDSIESVIIAWRKINPQVPTQESLEPGADESRPLTDRPPTSETEQTLIKSVERLTDLTTSEPATRGPGGNPLQAAHRGLASMARDYAEYVLATKPTINGQEVSTAAGSCHWLTQVIKAKESIDSAIEVIQSGLSEGKDGESTGRTVCEADVAITVGGEMAGDVLTAAPPAPLASLVVSRKRTRDAVSDSDSESQGYLSEGDNVAGNVIVDH